MPLNVRNVQSQRGFPHQRFIIYGERKGDGGGGGGVLIIMGRGNHLIGIEISKFMTGIYGHTFNKYYSHLSNYQVASI